jgi:PAS domain S-box-containing protein
MDNAQDTPKAAPSAMLQHCKREFAPLTVVGNWEWDFTSGAVTWSDGLFRLFGFEPGAVQPTFDLWASKLHPDDRSHSDAIALAAVTCGTTIDHQFRIIRDDGAVRWLANKGEVFANAVGQPSWASGALFDITELREAQIELARREERYKALATANSISEWRATPDGTMIEAPSWASYTGQDFRGCSWLESVHPDDVSAVAAIWEEMLRVGCALDYCFRVRHQSGKYRWVHGRAVPIKNIDGSVREWVGTTEDVHEKRYTSEQLRLNEQRLRLALSAGRMFTWDFDIRTGQVTRSENSQEVLGLGSGHISDLEKRMHPMDIEHLRVALDATISTSVPFQLEYRVHGAENETRWLYTRGKLVPTEIGAPHRILGVTVEISDRKKAEKKRQSDQVLIDRFHALTRIAGDFLWIAMPDGRVADMPEWRELTGQTLEEVRGWGWLCAVHPADRERVREALLSQCDSSSPREIEYRIRSRSGHYRLIKSRTTPVRRADGVIAEWIGTCTQTSEIASWPKDEAPDGAFVTEEAETTTGYQVRAARAILRWSVRDLAQNSGVSASTIRRIEEADIGLGDFDRRTLRQIRATLEEAGVRFGPVLGGKCGVGPA